MAMPTTHSRRRRGMWLLEAGGFVLATVALAVTGGLYGLLAGLVVVGIRLRSTAPVALGAGQLLLLLVFAPTAQLPAVAVVEGCWFVALCSVLLESESWAVGVGGVAVGVAVLGGSALFLMTSGTGVLTAAGVLSGEVLFVGYGVHRYELLRMGLAGP